MAPQARLHETLESLKVGKSVSDPSVDPLYSEAEAVVGNALKDLATPSPTPFLEDLKAWAKLRPPTVRIAANADQAAEGSKDSPTHWVRH